MSDESSPVTAPVATGTPEIGQSEGFKAAVEAFKSKAGFSHFEKPAERPEATTYMAEMAQSDAAEAESAPSLPEVAAKPAETSAKATRKGPITPDVSQKRLAGIENAKNQRALAAERDALRAQLLEYQRMDNLRASAKDDPYAWIKHGGFSDLDEFTAAIVEKGTMSPTEKKVFELERNLKQRDEEVRNQASRAQQAAEAAQMQAAKANLTTRLKNDREKYELATHGQGPELVYAVMTELANTKPNMTEADLEAVYHQAAEYVENIMEKDLEMILSYDKVKKKLGPNTKQPSTSAPRQSPPRSISSKMSATTAPAAPTQGTSQQDRIAWVAEQLKQRFSR